jgi:hypothetical protein
LSFFDLRSAFEESRAVGVYPGPVAINRAIPGRPNGNISLIIMIVILIFVDHPRR